MSQSGIAAICCALVVAACATQEAPQSPAAAEQAEVRAAPARPEPAADALYEASQLGM